MKIKTMVEILRGNVAETPETTNLLLKRDDFAAKMRLEENGDGLLDLLEAGESAVVERLELCHGYRENGEVWFKVPGWNNLVAHLKMVYGVPEPDA